MGYTKPRYELVVFLAQNAGRRPPGGEVSENRLEQPIHYRVLVGYRRHNRPAVSYPPYKRPLNKVLRNTTCCDLAKPYFADTSVLSMYRPCTLW